MLKQKNAVIRYLQGYELIKEIDGVFLSSAATRKIFKPETEYLKLFPVSQSASETAPFQMKLRTYVNLTFDHYFKKVFYNGNISMSTSTTNNIFNKTHHNLLLNCQWYDKLKEG
jgi:hypothetical protein